MSVIRVLLSAHIVLYSTQEAILQTVVRYTLPYVCTYNTSLLHYFCCGAIDVPKTFYSCHLFTGRATLCDCAVPYCDLAVGPADHLLRQEAPAH